MSEALAIAKRQCRLLLVAIQFLTRVPALAGLLTPFDSRWLNACVAYFPLVGALVGLLGAMAIALVSIAWPPVVAALLGVALTIWLTGAFHEDGLADTFDALGGNVTRESALKIMKDSRIGTYGATVLVFTLLLRVTLLSVLAA